MENQDEYIPEHLREEWDAVRRELGEASVELAAANNRYADAISARLAISRTLKDWQMKTYYGE